MPRKPDPVFEQECVTLAEGGWSPSEIAEHVDRPLTTVLDQLKRRNVEYVSKAKGYNRKLDDRELEKTVLMYTKLMMSMNEIAEHLAIKPSTVQYRLRAAGVKTRSRSEANRLAIQRGRRRASELAA